MRTVRQERQNEMVAKNRSELDRCEKMVQDLKRDLGNPIPAWVQSHMKKAEKGNKRALIALKCADCSCYQREEIRHCSVSACPLFPVRPYK